LTNAAEIEPGAITGGMIPVEVDIPGPIIYNGHEIIESYDPNDPSVREPDRYDVGDSTKMWGKNSNYVIENGEEVTLGYYLENTSEVSTMSTSSLISEHEQYLNILGDNKWNIEEFDGHTTLYSADQDEFYSIKVRDDTYDGFVAPFYFNIIDLPGAGAYHTYHWVTVSDDITVYHVGPIRTLDYVIDDDEEGESGDPRFGQSNDNGRIDAGEFIEIPISFKNDGDHDLLHLRITMNVSGPGAPFLDFSHQPGVSPGRRIIDYGNFGGGATSSHEDDFQFKVKGNYAGELIEFQIHFSCGAYFEEDHPNRFYDGRVYADRRYTWVKTFWTAITAIDFSPTTARLAEGDQLTVWITGDPGNSAHFGIDDIESDSASSCYPYFEVADDGVAPDLTAGDGIYSGVYTVQKDDNCFQGAVTGYMVIGGTDTLSLRAANTLIVDALAPQPPTGLDAEDYPGDHGGKINLTWNVSSDDVSGVNPLDEEFADVVGYKIYRRDPGETSFHLIANVAKGVDLYVDTAVPQDSVYVYYKATAYDENGNECTDTAIDSAMALDDGIDFTPPSFTIGLFKNPYLHKHIDVLCVPDEELKGSPLMTVSGPASVDTLAVSQIDSDPFIFKGHYLIPQSGSYMAVVQGEDMSNNVGADTLAFSTLFVLANQGGCSESIDGSVRVELPQYALDQDGYLCIARMDEESPRHPLENQEMVITPSYKIFCTSRLEVAERYRLSIHYDESLLPERSEWKLSIFKLSDDGNWTAMGGTVDEQNNVVETTMDQFGTFRIQVDQHKTAQLPTNYQMPQNYPNPFNPNTNITFTNFSTGDVKVAVYNIRGQLVTMLIDRELPPGEYGIPWNGTDSSGQEVSTGIYFCQVKCVEYSKIIQMVLLR
jgi:hypothetical protein